MEGRGEEMAVSEPFSSLGDQKPISKPWSQELIRTGLFRLLQDRLQRFIVMDAYNRVEGSKPSSSDLVPVCLNVSGPIHEGGIVRFHLV